MDETCIQDLVPECDNDRSSSGAFGGDLRLVYFKQAGFDEHSVRPRTVKRWNCGSQHQWRRLPK